MKNAYIFFVILFVLSFFGHAGAKSGSFDTVGVDERPGFFVPSDLIFRDETGREVILKKLMDRPVVLVPTYFTCSHICPQMLGSLAVALSTLPLNPEKDYRVITMSFDETDTPRDADNLKKNYLKAIGRPFPEDAWKFLTADNQTIGRILEAVGVKVKKAEHGFVHPEVLVFLSPGGKITRYLYVSKYQYGVAYPITFSGLDLQRSFSDALQGRVAATCPQEPLYCFLHEPGRQKLFFTVMKVSGAVTLALMLVLFVILVKRKGISRERRNYSGE